MRVLQIKSTPEALLRLGLLETLCAMAYPSDRSRGGLLLKEFVKSGTDQLTEPDADCLQVVHLDRFLWKGLGEPGRSSVREDQAYAMTRRLGSLRVGWRVRSYSTL